MFSATSHSIHIEVEPTFLEDQSEPEKDYFVWAYHVLIENRSERTVQLRSLRFSIST